LALKRSSTALSNDERIPCPRMATNVTRARPIISADAVDAVRFGLRIALSRASAPAAPPIRVAGQPSTDASGRTTREAFAATPKKRSRMPMPSENRRAGVARLWARTP